MDAPNPTPQPVATPTPEGQPPSVAPKERVSPQVQALMRKEAEAVRRLQQAKSIEAQVKAEREAVAAEKAKIEAWNNSWKENPLKAVQERGLTPEQLWIMQQQGGQMTADVKIQMLQDELRQLKEERNGEKSAAQKAMEADAERANAEQIDAFKGEIAQHVEASSEKYPLTHLYKRSDLIYSVIDRHHEKTERETGVGEVMTIEKASEIVEARLLSEARRAQEILQKTAPAESPHPPPQAFGRRQAPSQEQLWAEKPVKTLAQVQQSVPPSKATHFKSDEEREANALAILRAAKQRRGLA